MNIRFKHINRVLPGLLFWIGIGLPFSAIHAQDDGSEKESAEVHLRRSSILVSNLDQSLKLYQDVLGFEVGAIGTYEKDNYAYQVFNVPKEATIRVAALSSTDQKRIINLKEVTGVDLPKQQETPIMGVLLIKVDDLIGVIKKVKALGLKTTEEHTVEGRISYIEQAFTDFDGHRIALYQLL